MRYRLNICLLLITVLLTSCMSSSKESIKKAEPANYTDQSVSADTSKNEISTEILTIEETEEFLTPFDQHLTQAKVHYVDALLARKDQDSLEVEFQLSIVFDILSKIESYNGMDAIQHEQFNEFTENIIDDFEEYAPQMRELHESFSLSDLKDAMNNLTDEYFAGNEDKDYVVLEDRDGHVPIIVNDRVQTAIKMFQTTRRGDMQQWIKEKAKYERLFRKILRENNVPEEFIYLSMLESELKTDALSPAKAMGQWQWMGYMAKIFGLKYDYWVDERRDPVMATEAAARFMLYLYEEFNDWYLVMAAYNAGEGRIMRSIRYEHTRDYWQMKTLPRATRKYVPYIMAVAAICMEPEKYGFYDYKPQPIWGGDYDTLTLNKSYELEKIARVCGISFDKLKEMNPALRKFYTPSYQYTIRVPKGKRSILEREILVMEAAPTNTIYKVKSGDTLSEIALKYGVTVQDIVHANKLKSKSQIYIGQKLVLPQGGISRLSSSSTYSNGSSSSSSSGKPDLSASHRKIIYTVKPGDTLGEIAEVYDTRASRIRVWNGLVYGEYIHPNQKLTIWVPKGNSYQTVAQYYTVKSGDSFEKIAKKYGLSTNELKKLNPSMNYSKIYPGDKIRIQ